MLMLRFKKPRSVFICPRFSFSEFCGLGLSSFRGLSGKFSPIVAVGAPRVANQLLYVMEFTGSRTCLPLFPTPLATKRLYHIWHKRMALNLFKPWSLTAWAPTSTDWPLQAEIWRRMIVIYMSWTYNNKCVNGADIPRTRQMNGLRSV